MHVGHFVASFFIIFQQQISVSARWGRFHNGGFSDSENRQCCEFLSETRNFGPYVQQITHPFEHAEEPYWDPRCQFLYFVDIHQGLVNSFNPQNNEINSIKLDGQVTPVIPTNKLGQFVVGLNKTLILLEWDGKNGSNYTYKNLTSVDADKIGNRFNDGKPDKNGVLWIGTMGPENATGFVPKDEATFYKISADDVGNPTAEIRPVSISNGLAWSKDNKKLYYIDTPTRQIAGYDFDLETESISNKTVVFDFADYDIGGNPDGMTIDADDNLFIACFNGGAVIKVNPRTRKLLQIIAIPAARVTSVFFGGKYLDILYVTTSKFQLSAEDAKQQPVAGCLFAISNLNTRGRDPFYANFTSNN